MVIGESDKFGIPFCLVPIACLRKEVECLIVCPLIARSKVKGITSRNKTDELVIRLAIVIYVEASFATTKVTVLWICTEFLISIVIEWHITSKFCWHRPPIGVYIFYLVFRFPRHLVLLCVWKRDVFGEVIILIASYRSETDDFVVVPNTFVAIME